MADRSNSYLAQHSAGSADQADLVDLSEHRKRQKVQFVSFHRRELDLILNLYGRKVADGEWREEALAFERAFLLFDNSRIDDARATWRALTTAEGVEIHFWKQDERGRWSEGP